MNESKFKNSIKFKTIKSVLIGFIMAIIFAAGLFFGKANSYSYRALSHSGGTDSSGCHCVGGKSSNGSCPSGDYHCH